MSMQEKELIKIAMIKTNTVCFITDCFATSGFNYQYHKSKIKDFVFDGEEPQPTFAQNWFQINKYPEKVQRWEQLSNINRRFEIKDADMVSNKLPKVIPYDQANDYDSAVLEALYEYKSDIQKPVLTDVDCDIDIVLEIDKFELPKKIEYKAIQKDRWGENTIVINNANLEHQLLDKIIFPEVILHTRPCSISSYDLYSIIRQYIKDNIDTKYAKITSDYDFCFTVKKVIPKIEPEIISYHNIFAKNKKEREKTQYKVREYEEVTIFEMTHEQAKYSGYTVMQSIYADNENEMKEKIDCLLEHIITKINEPLKQCRHCNGTGYENDITKIKVNKRETNE